jgi:hypothetical protein
VASGVGTLTWIAFFPFALGFGAVSNRSGVHTAGWMIVAVTVVTAAALIKVASAHRTNPDPCPTAHPAGAVPEVTLATTGS